MKKFYLLLLLCASCLITKAVPAYPGLCTFTQKDGTSISFYLHGDEHFSYKTTEDGYLIAENDEGFMEYAYLKEDGSLSFYGMTAHNILERTVNEQNFVASLAKPEAIKATIKSLRQQRMLAAPPTRRNFPLKGTPRGLIILVSYQDVEFETPREDFDSLANQHDYKGTGSIVDYFTECSFGQFKPTFDVYGPYTLPENRAYYGGHSGGSHDANPYQMIIDACLAADDDVNFADYDNDGDGFVDNIFVFYAGNNEADHGPEESVWPHRSTVAWLSPLPMDGVSLADYACTSEFRGSSSKNMCGIGTFCHEFSHVLGLPDFYDTDYSVGLGAMGDWDIMTSGNRNNHEASPPTHTAYERFYLGWLTPTPLVNDSTVDCEGSYSLKSLISSNTAFLISATRHNLSGKGPNPKEFFMLEYRKVEGIDTYSGLADGLLITHINYNSSTWGSNGPNNDVSCLGYYPVLPNRQQAYGNSNDVYPNVADNCSFTLHGESTPLARKLINIANLDTACAFDYVSPTDKLTLTVADIDAYNAPVEKQFIVKGVSISENVTVSLGSIYEFAMRRHTADGSESYSTTLTLTPDTNNIVCDTIDVKYSPKKLTYDEYSDNSFMVKGTQTASLTKVEKFRYRNRRPVYVVEPVAFDPTEVAANSAVLNWSFVADTVAGISDVEKYGAKYYLDVYSTSDEVQIDTVDFENFPEELEDGWSANFETSTTAKSRSGSRSVAFCSASDTLYSKEYPSDIESVTLWYNSVSSTGIFCIDAQDYETGAWKTVKKFTVGNTTSGDTVFRPKKGMQYRRLKFYYVTEDGSLLVDFIRVQTSTSYTYVVKNEYLYDTTYTVQNLKLGQEYKFVVRASDRDEKVSEPRYENITKPSNEVVFKTKNVNPGTEGEDLTISVVQIEGANRYVVYISELQGDDYKLFVYNFNGVLVDILPATENPVMLPQLPVGQYILRYSKDDNKSKSGPTAKFHYTSYLK